MPLVFSPVEAVPFLYASLCVLYINLRNKCISPILEYMYFFSTVALDIGSCLYTLEVFPPILLWCMPLSQFGSSG